MMSLRHESPPSTRTVVLVADDDIHINALISRLLEREGFEVVRVRDGQDAITQIDERDVDILVLDLMMPRVDGFGVMNHLEKTRPQLLRRTIVVTAFPESETILGFRHVCRILQKPFDMSALLAAIRDCADA